MSGSVEYILRTETEYRRLKLFFFVCSPYFYTLKMIAQRARK